ncbi:hypothetical protein MPH_10777 [Macrophomina phaseolina MS6]|uniref:Uncharacterized protein n=1 Tax=Macrophomina phaseolina (strain MS6) TaxID=1126212 RepID=K2QQA8_MACPH|nr:hypothetical protein MPH_10777 [Macrophomina phaseolina MS6]
MPRVSPQHNSKDTVAGASPSSLSHTLSKHIAGSPANIIPRSSNYTPAPSLTMGAVQNSPSESLCANQAYGAARGHSSPSAAPSPPSPLGLRQRRPANRTGTVESSHFMTPELPSPAPARNPPAAQTSPGLHYQAPQAYPTDSAEASLFIMPEPEPPVPPPNLPPTQTLPQPDPRRRTDSAQPGALGTPDPAVPTPRTSTTTSNQTPLSAASTRRTPSTPTGRRSESRPFIRRVARYGYYEDRLGAYPDVDEDAEGGGVWCSGSDDSDSPVRPWGKRNAVRSRQPAVVSQDTEAAEENGNGAGVEFLRCKAIYDRKVADGKATQEDFVWISGLEADEKRRKEVLEKGKRQRKDDKAAAVPKITRCGMFRRRLGDHVNESSSISLGAEEDSDEEDTPSTTNSPPRPPPPSVRKQYGMFSKPTTINLTSQHQPPLNPRWSPAMTCPSASHTASMPPLRKSSSPSPSSRTWLSYTSAPAQSLSPTSPLNAQLAAGRHQRTTTSSPWAPSTPSTRTPTRS